MTPYRPRHARPFLEDKRKLMILQLQVMLATLLFAWIVLVTLLAKAFVG